MAKLHGLLLISGSFALPSEDFIGISLSIFSALIEEFYSDSLLLGLMHVHILMRYILVGLEGKI